MEDDTVKKYQEVLEKYAADMNPNPVVPKTPVEATPAPTLMISERTSQVATPPVADTVGTPVFIKILFTLSLIAFFGVAATIGYNFYRSMNGATPDNPVATLPTTAPRPTIMGETCLLNDKNYKVGESFSSADGCNTCTCGSDLTIACTDKSCETTPSVSTKPSPTSKVKATPTVKPKLSPTISLSAAKDACLQNQFNWVSKYSECDTALQTTEANNKLKAICDVFGGKYDGQSSSCRHVVITDTSPCGPDATAVCSFAK